MSRTTASIMRISKELDKISGLDGIVADMVEQKENEIKSMVECILKYHSNANIFNYFGKEEEKIIPMKCIQQADIINDVESVIDVNLTNYNIRRVIEQLKEKAENARVDCMKFNDEYAFASMNAYCDAIAIVESSYVSDGNLNIKVDV